MESARQNSGAAALPSDFAHSAARMGEIPDHDPWKPWFQRYGPRLLLCARQWTRSLADAEDVVQEAFLRFWRRQRHLAGDGDSLPLLLTSVRRAALDRARRDGRRQRREERSAEDPAVEEPLFEPDPANDDRRKAVEAALARLPREQREALVLKIWGGLTFAEVAASLGIPPDTAASRYRYALAALRRELNAVDCHG
jgi:RNA polymerase sigma factor (sigma-70 family)